MRKIIPLLAAALLTATTIAPALAETTVETKPVAPEQQGGGRHEGCCKMMHEMRQMHEQMMMDHMKSMHRMHQGHGADHGDGGHGADGHGADHGPDHGGGQEKAQ